MPLIESRVERGTPVTGGPKLHPLLRDLRIGDQGVIRGDKLRNIGQQRRHGGLARIRTDRHMMADFFGSRNYGFAASEQRNPKKSLKNIIAATRYPVPGLHYPLHDQA